MGQTKTTAIEKSIRRTLFYRRIAIGFGILVLLSLLACGGFVLFNRFHEAPFVPPSYEKLNADSPGYWIDRTMIDITSSKETEDKNKNPRQLYRSLMNTLNQTRKISSQFERFKAVTDIAVTMAQNDIDINIDNIILELGETPTASATRARILVSQGLMYLRVNKRPAARVAIQAYDRLTIDADLKLNLTSNELAFFGAVTALVCLNDMDKLNEVLNRQIDFALRMTTDQRMRAYRLIAGEQARAGMSVYAMNTVQKITNPIEKVRAYQSIIFFTARPQTIKPTEPDFFLPPTTGPWEPLPAPTVAKQIIDDVLKQIAAGKSLEEQVDILTMLTGSRLMCDPELHRVFRESVAGQTAFNDIVKQPILQHLDEPRSELIRTALQMPPLPKEMRRSTDSAADDWTSPTGILAIGDSQIKPTLMKELVDQQMIRVYLMTSQCYQMVGRYSDALQVLRKAAVVAKERMQLIDQFQNLLKIGEHLLSAGNLSEARLIFQDIKIPNKQGSELPAWGRDDTAPELTVTIFRERLSGLARLQIVGRFFSDAMKTISQIEPESYRDDDLAFLAMEQIRICRFEEAAQTIGVLADASRKFRLQHTLAIAQGEGEEHYDALKIPYPGKLRSDTDLSRCCEILIQNGLFGIAAKTAEKIENTELQSKVLTRIIREYILLFKAYGEDSEWHRSVREFLLSSLDAAAGKIAKPAARAYAQEAILSGVLPYAQKEKRTDFLLVLFDDAVKSCRQISTPEDKAELMGRLILSRITLEADEKAVAAATWPLIDRSSKPNAVEEIAKLINEAVEAVNESGDVPKRGYALSFLAKALGQIGRTPAARKLLSSAEETAKEFSDKRESISVLLSLVPTFKALNDPDAVRNIYSTAFTIVSNTFIEMPNTAEAMFEWRQRDSELDRIIRSLLEQGFIVEAIAFAGRVSDPLLRDRLLRVAVYIYLDEGNFVSAESTVRKIELSTILEAALRDVLFVKRRLAAEKAEGENPESEKSQTGKPEITPLEDEKPALLPSITE